MRDMKSHGDRSIRNIPVSSGSHRRPPNRFQDDVPLPKRRRSRKFLWWGLGVLVVCIAAGLLLATLFEGATVTITPKTQQVTPPANLTALPNAPAGSLGYQTVSLSQSATTTATASGTTHVSKSASGPITISNTTSAKQALIANTRFQTSGGSIYRIHSAVTVPAKGSVIATVYADAPGPAYNLANATSFSIPGFKGDARYTAITAGAAAGAISGGFVGDTPTVTKDQMQTAQLALQKQLDAALRTALGNAVPNGFLPVQGSLAVTYGDIAETQGQGNAVSLSQSATASMAIVNGQSLAGLLAKLLVKGYGGEPVAFGTPNPLILQMATTTSNTNTGPLTLLLQGVPTLVWQFDQTALKNALLGKEKGVFETVIEGFAPAIQKAEASVRPFWKGTFPTDPSKLIIQVDAQ